MSIGTFGLMAASAAVKLIARSIVNANNPAQITYASNGSMSSQGAANPAIGLDEWLEAALQGAGAGNPFEIRATVISGTILGSDTGDYLSLSTDRLWSVATGTSGVIDVTIRRVGESVDYPPARIDLVSAT